MTAMTFTEIKKSLVGKILKYSDAENTWAEVISDIKPHSNKEDDYFFKVELGIARFIILPLDKLDTLAKHGIGWDDVYRYSILSGKPEPINWEQRYYDMVVAKFAHITKPLTEDGKLELLAECLQLVNLYKDYHNNATIKEGEEPF